MSTSGSTTTRASGTFEVDSWHDEVYDSGTADTVATLGRARLTKTFQGDMVGTSSVEMLGVSIVVEGSAEPQGVAYVAVERVTASVHGRTGSFVLTHAAGPAGMTVAVVAGSASGELAGLTGELSIDRRQDGSHHYTFDYTL